MDEKANINGKNARETSKATPKLRLLHNGKKNMKFAVDGFDREGENENNENPGVKRKMKKE